MKILAIDLGKFKSVACLFDTETNQAQDETIAMQRGLIEDLLQRQQPQKVVIETCTNSLGSRYLPGARLRGLGCQPEPRGMAMA